MRAPARTLARPVAVRIDLPDGPFIVAIYPDGTLGFRPLRKAKEYLVPLTSCYLRAVEVEAERLREGRRTSRRVRRGLLS